MYTIAAIEDEAARRIESLDATEFQEGTFHRAGVPMTATQEPSLLAHLAFSASIESATARDDENAPGDRVLVVGDLRVVFVYRIRAGAQADDYRAASEAARRVAGILLAHWDDAAIQPVTLWRPGPIVNDHMPVELRFNVAFDLSVSPTFAPVG